MNIELKPCPFCGGEAEVRVSPNSRSEEGASRYEVRCKKCGVFVTGEAFDFWVVKYNKKNPQDRLSAVERWNKRAHEENGRKTGVSRWINRTEDGYVECPVCGHLTTCGSEDEIENLRYCFWCGTRLEVERE